jgi:CHAD domain-containing protein
MPDTAHAWVLGAATPLAPLIADAQMSPRTSAPSRDSDAAAKSLPQRFNATLRGHWRNYRRIFKRCRREFSMGDVHRLRIESRRLLSLLDLVVPIAGAKQTDKARRRFKKTLRTSSSLRDTQVQLQMLKKELRPIAGATAIRHALRQRARKLVRRIGKEMKRTKLDRMQDAVERVVRAVRSRYRRATLPKRDPLLMVAAVDRAFGNVLRLSRAIEPARPATIHRARVAFKKFRYMVEALEEVLPGTAHDLTKEMQTYQARMGDIQDTEVFLVELSRLRLKKRIGRSGIAALRKALQRTNSVRVARFLAGRKTVLRFWPHHRTELRSRNTSQP